MIRSLVVGPQKNLDISAELQRLINALHPTKVLLGDEATLLNVADALSADHYDLVIFSAHGSMRGIDLADGTALTKEMVQIFQGTQVRCIFLNTCESVGVAIRLHDALETVAVISTVGEIHNRTATLTGALFARHVAAGMSWREAYDLSKPGDNIDYVYINDHMLGNEMLLLIEEIRGSSKDLNAAFQREMGGVSARLRALEERRRPTWERRVAWTMGFMLFAYVVHPLSYAEVRAFWAVSLWEAALLTIFVSALSGLLMLWSIKDR